MSDGAPYTRSGPGPRELAGRVLDHRYRVEQLLGAGGMGAVYQAWQITLEKRVAIKILKPDYADREDAVKRFLREARAASKIAHRNVVEVLDFGQTADGLVYFVMEFLDGQDLSAVIRRGAPLRWRRAKRILLQIMRALNAAHAHGIVHRDVKPANCFLVSNPDDEPDYIKVLDFGIAKVVAGDGGLSSDGLTSTSQVMGTALYMAPEQAMGRTIDARTDIYALGVMAYEMLTGKQPFTGATTFEVLMRRVNEPPPRLSLERPELGPRAEDLLQRAMARDPVARYQTMKEFESALLEIDDALEAPTDEAPVAAAPTGPHSESDPRPVTDEARATATSARHKIEQASQGRAPTVLYGVGEVPAAAAAPTRVVSSGGTAVAAVPEQLSAPQTFDDMPKSGSRAWVVAALVLVVLGIGGGVWWTLRDPSPADAASVTAASAKDEPPAEVAAEDGKDAAVPDMAASAPDGPEVDAEPADPPAGGDAPIVAPGRDAPPDAGATAPAGADATPTKSTSSGKTRRAKKPRGDSSAKTPPKDSAVLASLRRKAKGRCKTGTDGATVRVQFLIDGSGSAGMARNSGSTDDAARVQCVVRLVEGARFASGSSRPSTLKVQF